MEIVSKLRNYLQQRIIKQIINNLDDISDTNLIRLTYISERLANERSKKYITAIRNALKQRHPAVLLIRKILKNIDQNCRNKFINNLVLKGLLLNDQKRVDALKNGSAVPYTILISPTMKCNLKCEGCYAFSYSKDKDLSLEVIDKVILEAKEMGVAFFTVLGGEPFIRKDIFEIYKKHEDFFFQVFTNGTLIDEMVCEDLKKVGNVVPMISVEGFKENTDERRGKKIYDKAIKAMELLKKHKIPFGYSVCVTRKNEEEIFSDKFVDSMISKGAYLGWYFLYMPVCGNPDISLMPTPEQRLHMLKKSREIRKDKPIFIIDFWNDAPYVKGCIAGKCYAHVTSNGDVEPCIFTHFAVDNIKNKSLREIMDSEFFKELRKRQPYNKNLFLPCMWIDNPEISREFYKKFKLKPTHPGAEDILKKDKFKKAIDRYSKEVKKLYAPLWEERLKH